MNQFIPLFKEKSKKILAWIKENKTISLFIALIFVFIMVSMFGGASTSTLYNTNSSDTPVAPVITDQQKQDLADLFCANRTGKYVGHISLDDFSSMLESGKETMLHTVYAAPSEASCLKIAGDCLAEWSLDECQKIAGRKIWIGMSENELLLSWGFPIKKNDTVGSWGIDTQWIYADYSQYVYLRGNSQDNLTVYSWQND